MNQKRLKLFLSYCFDDELFIQRVSYYFRKQNDLDPYCYSDKRHENNFIEELGINIAESHAFLLFLGPRLGDTQKDEAKLAIAYKIDNRNDEFKLRIIELPEHIQLPPGLTLFKANAPEPIKVKSTNIKKG